MASAMLPLFAVCACLAGGVAGVYPATGHQDMENILSRNLRLAQQQQGSCHEPPATVSPLPADGREKGDHILLIARYDEPLDWLARLLVEHASSSSGWITNVLILDKGVDNFTLAKAKLPSDRVRLKKIPNVGREGETLLNYVIEHYNRLPERVWFLQADPFEHQPQLSAIFSKAVVAKYDDQFQSLTTQFAEYARIPETILVNEDKQLDGMVREVWITSNSGDIMFANGWIEGKVPGVLGVDNIMKDLQDELGVERFDVIPRTVSNAGKPLARTDILLPYTMSAMFAVSRDAIRSNPVEFYLRVRDYLLYNDKIGKAVLAKSKSGSGMYTCEWFRQVCARHGHTRPPRGDS
jgi:hypothetical protein